MRKLGVSDEHLCCVRSCSGCTAIFKKFVKLKLAYRLGSLGKIRYCKISKS